MWDGAEHPCVSCVLSQLSLLIYRQQLWRQPQLAEDQVTWNYAPPPKTHPNISTASSEGALEAAKTQSLPHALFTSSQLGKLLSSWKQEGKKPAILTFFFSFKKLPAGNRKSELFIYIFHVCSFFEIDETTATERKRGKNVLGTLSNGGKNNWSRFLESQGKDAAAWFFEDGSSFWFWRRIFMFIRCSARCSSFCIRVCMWCCFNSSSWYDLKPSAGTLSLMKELFAEFLQIQLGDVAAIIMINNFSQQVFSTFLKEYIFFLFQLRYVSKRSIVNKYHRETCTWRTF